MFELNPTEENIINVIKNDYLERNKAVLNFLKILYSLNEQYSLCIDGRWGEGKTFFVKQCLKTIELINKDLNQVDKSLKKYKNDIDSVFEKIDCKNEFFPIYFNAWEYDSNREPLLTFIYSMINDLNLDVKTPSIDKSIFDKLKKLMSSFKFGGTIIDSNSGLSVTTELQYVKNDEKNLLNDVISSKEIEKNFINILNSLLPERSNKVVIFIDELDRCNPIYAVKLLESFKHFFKDDKFIFVFSTNIMELKNTINCFYGNNFNSSYYLQKFFDLQFELPNVNMDNYIKNCIKLEFDYYQKEIIKGIINEFKFSLRDCNKFFSMYKLVKNYMDNFTSFDYTVSNDLTKYVVFPILLALKITNYEFYHKIISGTGKQEFIDLIIPNESFMKIINNIVRNIPDEKLNIDLLLNDLYDCLFIRKLTFRDFLIMNEVIPFNIAVSNQLKEILSFINGKIVLENL